MKKKGEGDEEDDGDLEIIEGVPDSNRTGDPIPQERTSATNSSAVDVPSLRGYPSVKFESVSSPGKHNYLDSHDNDDNDDEGDSRDTSNVSTPLNSDFRPAYSQERFNSCPLLLIPTGRRRQRKIVTTKASKFQGINLEEGSIVG